MRSPVETCIRLRRYSPAIARAKKVLPTPGGAVEKDSVPLDPVTLGVVWVLEHESNGFAYFLLQGVHPAPRPRTW